MNPVYLSVTGVAALCTLSASAWASINSPENYPQEYQRFLKNLDEQQKKNSYDFSFAANTVFMATNDELAMPVWMEKAMKDEHPVATYYIANQHRLTFAMEESSNNDHAKAEMIYKLYEKAAQSGFVPAIIHQAGCLVDGFGVKKDKDQAVKLLAQASRSGDKNARLRWLQLTDRFLKEEDLQRKEVLSEMERGNDAIIYAAAALCKDPAKQAEYLRKAAELNNGNAYAQLSRILSKTDPAESFALAIKGAQAFNAECMATIGYCMLDPEFQKTKGIGANIPHDPSKGMYLLKIGAMLHSPYGHMLLGKIYEEGLFGMAKDEQRAFRHYEQATLRHDSQSQLAYAYCLIKGIGTPAKPKEAQRHLLYLARRNVVPAISLIAYCHYKGLGVEKDEKNAKKILVELSITYPIAYIYLAEMAQKAGDKSSADHNLRLASLVLPKEEVEKFYKDMQEKNDWIFDL